MSRSVAAIRAGGGKSRQAISRRGRAQGRQLRSAPGEIHALCGENGAGKSTLIKTLGGIHVAGTYEGTIRVDGDPAAFTGPKDAEKAGIAVIYQELALVPEMTVAENVFLGSEPRRLGGLAIDWHRVYRESRALLDRFGLDIDPMARVDRLGVGHRQLVEIAKALSKNTPRSDSR